MFESGSKASTLKLVGGRLSLDFANTVDWHADDNHVEYLLDYSDLVAWCWHAGILSVPQAQAILEQAGRRPAGAAQVLARAVSLRESIYHIFSAISHGCKTEANDLTILNEELAKALARLTIVETGEGFDWGYNVTADELDNMFLPVVRDAADLLTSPSLHRVRECAGDRCGWLFVDTSRNGSRRWCVMEDCGNRAKARRHYQRSHTLKQHSDS